MIPILATALVVILDTGLDLKDSRFTDMLCNFGHADFTGEGLKDTNGHGTHVAGIIKEYAGEASYCAIIVKFYGEKSSYINALEYALALQPNIINISGGGSSFDEGEANILVHNKKSIIVAAAGNEGENIIKHPYYPASYPFPNIISVGCEDCLFSNYGRTIKMREKGSHILSTLPKGKKGYMSGTSQATAITTGKIIRRLYGH